MTMDFVAKTDATVDPQSGRLVCTLRRRPPETGRVKIDGVFFPYRLQRWNKKLEIATLQIEATPDSLAYKRNPDVLYMTTVLLVGYLGKDG